MSKPYSGGGDFGGWSDGGSSESFRIPDLENVHSKVIQFQQNIKTGGSSAAQIAPLPKLPCIHRVLDTDPGTEVSQEQFDEFATISFFADTSSWASERMKAIAEAASLPVTLPSSVEWVTLNTPHAERDRRLELGTIFGLPTAMFIVDKWMSGSSVYHSWDYNGTTRWPSWGPVPDFSGNKVYWT